MSKTSLAGTAYVVAIATLALVACSQVQGAVDQGATHAAKEANANVSPSGGAAPESVEKPGSEPAPKSTAPDSGPPMGKTASVPPLPQEAAIAAAPGVRTVKPGAPSFCAGSFEAYSKRGVEDADRLKKMLHKDLDYVQQDWARIACTYGTNPNAQQWVAAFKQRLVNLTAMPAWALNEHLAFHLTRSSSDISDAREAHEACEPFSEVENAHPIDGQLSGLLRGFLCGGLAESGRTPAIAWFYDRNSEPPSPLHRAALVERVLGRATEPEVDVGDLESDGALLTKFAFVRTDWEAMDDAEFRKALSRHEMDRYQRWHAINAYFGAKRRGQQLARGYAKLGEKNELIGELADDVPKRGFSNWVSSYEKNKSMVDRVLQVERAWLAGDREVIDGCNRRLREEYSAFVKSNAPESKRDIQALAARPMGYVALTALYRCEEANGENHRAKALGRLVEESAKWRGPRTAAVFAVYGRYASKAGDRLDLEPYLPFVPSGGRGALWFTNDWDYQNGVGAPSYQSYANGIVKSVTDAGEMKKVSFRQSTTEYPILKCKEVTPRVIERIEPDGEIVYREKCWHAGTKTVQTTTDPILVDPELAKGIEPGRYLHAFQLKTDDGRRLAYPLELYDSSNKEKLLSYYGIPLN